MKKFKKPIMLRTHFKKLVKDLNDNFKGVGADFDSVYEQLDELNQLKEEFSGLHKNHQRLREDVNDLNDKFNDLEHNGVATAINRLNAEVFGEKTDGDTSAFERAWYRITETEPAQKVTLRGKLDAVIQHLGLDISVKPRQVEESKVVAKKVKQTKKGKK